MISAVKRACWIMRKQAILDNEWRYVGCGMTNEKDVVTHAQPNHDVELCSCFIKNFGLANRIAY